LFLLQIVRDDHDTGRFPHRQGTGFFISVREPKCWAGKRRPRSEETMQTIIVLGPNAVKFFEFLALQSAMHSLHCKSRGRNR
jgi:hypothetical protein